MFPIRPAIFAILYAAVAMHVVQAQFATHNIAFNGGPGFTGTLAGNVVADVKLQSGDGSQLTYGILNVVDLDVVTVSDGGFGNLFPNSTSLDNQGATFIAIPPTTLAIDIPAAPFANTVGGFIGVTAGDRLAGVATGIIDGGAVGSDGAWDDPDRTGVLNGAQVNEFEVALNNPINIPAYSSGLIAAALPGNVTIPNIVSNSAVRVDLVVKQTSAVAVDFNRVQNIRIEGLSFSSSQPVSAPAAISNFDESAHPTGYPQRDLSAFGGGLVETTVRGNLVADLQGTLYASIDLRADVSLLGLVDVQIPFEDAIHGEQSNGTLLTLSEPLGLSDAVLPFAFSILHEPTQDIDFDDVIASVRSGTFGFTLPFSFEQKDLILSLPASSFEEFNLLYRVDEGVFAEGWIWIPHVQAEIGGQVVLDVSANLELSADLLATAYLQQAINVVPEPSSLALAGWACLGGAALAGQRLRFRRTRCD